jgi:Spy/CpxP family protein refolding chaperone
MRFRNCGLVALAAALVLGGAALTRAEDKAGSTSPKPVKKEAKAKAVRLTKPWSGIASLTDEQKSKIAELHKKSVEEQKEVEKREKEAIMAVLTDEQKAELKAMQEKETADKKMKKTGGAAKTTDKTSS